MLACCSGRSILRHFSTRQKVCDLGPPSSAGSAPIYWNSTSSTCNKEVSRGRDDNELVRKKLES